MSYFLSIFLSLSVLNVWGADLVIHKMRGDRELERSYFLQTNLVETVVLDCQSFIQGLRIGEGERSFTYLLDEYECDDLTVRIKQSLKKRKRHCLDLGEEIYKDYSCQ